MFIVTCPRCQEVVRFPGAGPASPCPTCGMRLRIKSALPPTPPVEQIKVAEPPLPEASPIVAALDAAADQPKTKRCPYCAETVNAAARVCRYCGRDFPSRFNPALASGSTSLALRVLFWLFVVLCGLPALFGVFAWLVG